jgi:hypothetical protein
MTLRLLLLVGIACLPACKATSGRPPILVDPTILPEVSARASTWNQPRTTITFAGGEASNCAGYDRLKNTGIVEEVSNQLVKSEYLICDVLGKMAKSVAVEPMALDEHFGEALAQRLDLRSFPSSLGQRLDDEHNTLSDLFDARQLKIEPRGVEVSSNGWSYGLKVVLVGDIDQNGSTDWLIWFSDEASGGNYRDYATLMVDHVTNAGPLRANAL